MLAFQQQLKETHVTRFELAHQNLIASLESQNHAFSATLAFIDEWYEFTPSGFQNGPVRNENHENQSSGKLLALAEQLQLSHQQLLYCFGEHYRNVLAIPDADNHFNLRYLVANDTPDVQFDHFPLTPKAGIHDD